ncbi:MAG: cysteine hydrolase [Rhodospirillales bacterium]|nr:cysteine hydrolase [Rhodospirillales bacterium]
MTASQLLIIDVQAGFINEWTAHVPDRVASLQENFDQVLVTRLYNPQKSLYRKLIGWSGFALGSIDTQLAFAPGPSAKIIDKSTYSCVNGALVDRLRRDDIARVHLCGIGTDSSVLMSAIDLFQVGIEPVILAHACGSACGRSEHQAGLQILRRLIGTRQVIGS